MATQEGTDIQDRLDRLEEIAETLEEGNVDLATARELREEADDHLSELREELAVGDGDIIELEGEEVDLDSAASERN